MASLVRRNPVTEPLSLFERECLLARHRLDGQLFSADEVRLALSHLGPNDLSATEHRALWVESLIEGFRYVIPLSGLGDGKLPAIRWKEFQRAQPTPSLVRTWFLSAPRLRRPPGAAVLTGYCGYIGVDPDSAAAIAWVNNHLGPPAFRVESRPGHQHLYYPVDPAAPPIRQRLCGHLPPRDGTPPVFFKLDVKGFGAYLVAPGSIHVATGNTYRYAAEPSSSTVHCALRPNPAARPLVASAFDHICFCGLSSNGRCDGSRRGLYIQSIQPASARDESGRRVDVAVSSPPDGERRYALSLAERYIQRRSGSSQGQRHAALYRAACYLRVDLALDAADSLVLLQRLNQTFAPPLAIGLEKFVADAERYARGTSGSALGQRRQAEGENTSSEFRVDVEVQIVNGQSGLVGRVVKDSAS